MSTGIEWTEETWNPTVGCHKVSPGCKHCYAATMHKRLTAMGSAKYSEPFSAVRVWEPSLSIPLGWRKPRTVFVNSMSDLFHQDVTNEQISTIFSIMALCDHHTFQVLTKRAERLPTWAAWAQRLGAQHHAATGEPVAAGLPVVGVDDDLAFALRFSRSAWPVPNLWLGVSVESADHIDRIKHLQATPAAVRFLSLEPLLGPIPNLPLDGISWVIVGGESGPGARPMHPDWARSIRDQCVAAGVPFFFKQWGQYGHSGQRISTGKLVFRQFDTFQTWVNKAQSWMRPGDLCLDAAGRRMRNGGDMMQARDEGTFPVTILSRLGKKAAGRLLDERTWDEVPTS